MVKVRFHTILPLKPGKESRESFVSAEAKDAVRAAARQGRRRRMAQAECRRAGHILREDSYHIQLLRFGKRSFSLSRKTAEAEHGKAAAGRIPASMDDENPGRKTGVFAAKREGKIRHAKGHTNFRG